MNSAVNKIEKVLDTRINIIARRADDIDTLKVNMLSLNSILKDKVYNDDFKEF